jgi:hypothetical protein
MLAMMINPFSVSYWDGALFRGKGRKPQPLPNTLYHGVLQGSIDKLCHSLNNKAKLKGIDGHKKRRRIVRVFIPSITAVHGLILCSALQLS